MSANRANRHPGYWAALAHRLSGVALALFLPVHFLVLGTALQGEAAMDGVLAFADMPLVKAAEWGLVVLLVLHLSLGLRVLVLEFLPWRGPRKGLIGVGVAAAALAGVAFIVSAG